MLGLLNAIMKAHYLICLKSRKLGKWLDGFVNGSIQTHNVSSTADMIWELRCRNYWVVRYLSQNKCQSNYIPSVNLTVNCYEKYFVRLLKGTKLNMKGCAIHYF